MQLSNVYANLQLDWLLGANKHPDAPANVKVWLCSAAPNVDGTYTPVTGGGYGPVTLANNGTNFPDAVSRSKTNGVVIDFGTVTGTALAAPATHWVLTDDDDVLITGAQVPVSFTGNVGDSADFPIGTMPINSPSS